MHFPTRKSDRLLFRIRKRVQRLSQNIFAWPLAIWRADIEDIKRLNGLDAYFYVRFLRLMAIMFLPIWFITWAVLIPVTLVGTQVSGLSGLDRFTFGNVENTKQTRYAAHVVLAWFITCMSRAHLLCQLH